MTPLPERNDVNPCKKPVPSNRHAFGTLPSGTCKDHETSENHHEQLCRYYRNEHTVVAHQRPEERITFDVESEPRDAEIGDYTVEHLADYEENPEEDKLATDTSHRALPSTARVPLTSKGRDQGKKTHHR